MIGLWNALLTYPVRNELLFLFAAEFTLVCSVPQRGGKPPLSCLFPNRFVHKFLLSVTWFFSPNKIGRHNYIRKSDIF